MGVIIKREVAENRDIPCRGYRYNGNFLLWKQGVIGTLTDDQEKSLCDMAISFIEPMPDKMQERVKLMKTLEQKPKCMPRDAKDEAVKVLVDVMATAKPPVHEQLLRAYLFLEDQPVCP